MEHRKLYTAKRLLSFVVFWSPIALTFLWFLKDPSPTWAFHVQSLGISWQAIAGFVSFMAMAVWSFLDKKGVWE